MTWQRIVLTLFLISNYEKVLLNYGDCNLLQQIL
jgi:hypothetical protein